MEVSYEFGLAEQKIKQGVHVNWQNGMHDLATLMRRGALCGGHKSNRAIEGVC